VSETGPNCASPAYRTPLSSYRSGAPSTYSNAMARTSGEVSVAALVSQSLNHAAFSAPACHSCGASRIHTSSVTAALVHFGSRNVRLGPATSTVREPSVNVASSFPAVSCTSVRAGPSARSNTHSSDDAGALALAGPASAEGSAPRQRTTTNTKATTRAAAT